MQEKRVDAMVVPRKVSASSNYSDHLGKELPSVKTSSNSNARTSKKTEKSSIPDFSSDYYKNVNKYTFNKNFKKTGKREPPSKLTGQISPRGIKTPQVTESPRSNRSNSNYKYNLFSIMDEQSNQGCSTGFCIKNEFIAPKIKKRW